MGKKMATGEKDEPKPIKGKAGAFQSMSRPHTTARICALRFSKQPPGAEKMDKRNNASSRVHARGQQSAGRESVWLLGNATPMRARCRKRRTTKRPNCSEGTAAGVKTVRSCNGPARAETRWLHWPTSAMDGSRGWLKRHTKEGDGGRTFTRKLAGGEGDVALATGKTVNFGFAVTTTTPHSPIPSCLARLYTGHDARPTSAANSRIECAWIGLGINRLIVAAGRPHRWPHR